MKARPTGSGQGRAGRAIPVRRTLRIQALHRGFTLIELMIVVAIVGILAAIAVPAYQDFVVKSQIARGFWEASAYKIPVEERLLNGVHAFPDPVGTLGYVKSALTATANTFVFNDDGSGSIGVMLDGDVHPMAKGTQITVGRLTDGSWNCSVKGGNADFKSSYLPLACSLDAGP